MAEVVWTRRAIAKLDLIRAYIAQFDPEAAQRFAARLIEAGESLREFPRRGRPASSDRRELVVIPPYVIRYRVDGDRVVISDVKHGRQQRP